MGRIFVMKYIEELSAGDSFEFSGSYYVLTSDHKRNGNRQAINLNTGFAKWFDENEIVDICPVYILDEDNNIIALRNTEKQENAL